MLQDSLGFWIHFRLGLNFLYSFFFRNLVSILALDKVGFHVSFGNSKFDLIEDSIVVDFGLLCDSLYKLSVHHSFEKSFFINSSCNKRDRIIETPLCYGIGD